MMTPMIVTDHARYRRAQRKPIMHALLYAKSFKAGEIVHRFCS